MALLGHYGVLMADQVRDMKSQATSEQGGCQEVSNGTQKSTENFN
jgi:hypothetical protein